jgi:enoyl-[acyl-carrier protein] reductase II
VAAGGIGDGRGLLAAFALGAEGVEVGTRFLCTRECSAPDWYKQAILRSEDASTLVLGGDVMPIRVLKNKKALAAAHPEKAKEDERMRSGGEEAYVERDADEAIMPAGQVASLIKEITRIADVFPGMVDQTRAIASELNLFLRE